VISQQQNILGRFMPKKTSLERKIILAGLVHHVLRILKSLEKTQDSKKIKINFVNFCKNTR
jgi:hypothetical protein